MIRKAKILFLMIGSLLLSVSAIAVEAAEPVFTKAKDIYTMAEHAVYSPDKPARLIRAEYHWGRADLTFRTGEFVFNVPQLKNEGGKRSSVRITVRDGKMKGVKKEAQHWVEFDPPDPDPAKAFDVADKAGLGDWMSKHKKAGLSMELILWNRSMSFARGSSPWVWRVRAWGPEVPEDFDLYLDAGKLNILGGKSAAKSQAPGKKDKTQQLKPVDQGKTDKPQQPQPDDSGKSDKLKTPTPTGDGKPDKSKKPKESKEKPQDKN